MEGNVSAVRDDRAPGGKQKAKKLRLDDDSTIMSSIFNNVVLDAYDDQMIQALIDAKPDLVPSAEGAGIIDLSMTSFPAPGKQVL